MPDEKVWSILEKMAEENKLDRHLVNIIKRIIKKER